MDGGRVQLSPVSTRLFDSLHRSIFFALPRLQNGVGFNGSGDFFIICPIVTSFSVIYSVLDYLRFASSCSNSWISFSASMVRLSHSLVRESILSLRARYSWLVTITL
jgi:hypothetical protein